ncbi:MAG: CHASE3 domain-containing protein [Ferruginibacter sp.]
MKRVFDKIKPDKRIIIGYSSSLFLLLITYLVTIFANKELRERTSRVEHTYKLIASLDALMSVMKDAETGVRGYGLTKNSDFLEPYINSNKAADSICAAIMEQTKSNVNQQDRLAEIKTTIQKRFEIFDATLDAYGEDSSINSYGARRLMVEGKTAMDKIRRTVAIMQNEENRILAERDVQLKSTFASIRTITITSLLLTVLLVIIGFVTYTNENRARKLAMQNIRDYQLQLSKRIDELNNANAQLVQMRSMEKFTATGRIARTIAHEVRNPLTNINLATSQLKTDLSADDENTQYLFDIIDRNSNRINKLISDLLHSTKFSDLNFKSMDVNELVDETLAMAEDRIELSQVKIEKNYGAACQINVDVEKIKIAILNIIINAMEAMEDSDKSVLKISTKTEGANCIITIADNGVGMDETTLGKLFEPYFTNKPNGNGLGLANTQNIIFNHKGTVNVISSPGQGTIFTIKLAIA